MASLLRRGIKDAIKSKLESIPELQGIPVTILGRGNILAQVEANLASTGIGIVVSIPTVNIASPNIPGPYFDGGVAILIVVYEHTAINQGAQGSQKYGEDVAETILAYLHLYHPTGMGIIRGREGVAITEDQEGDIYLNEINLVTHGGLSVE